MNTIQFEFSPEDRQLLLEIKDWLTTRKAENNPDSLRFYTRKEVAKLFNINLSTLHSWTKNGTLKAVGIGSRVYYTQEAIDEALTKLN